jgi:hypothetical protein
MNSGKEKLDEIELREIGTIEYLDSLAVDMNSGEVTVPYCMVQL